MQQPGWRPAAAGPKVAWADSAQQQQGVPASSQHGQETFRYTDATTTSTNDRSGPVPAPQQQRQQQGGPGPGHSTTTFAPHDFPHPKRPLGDPAVTELNPQSASQNIRLKHRAGTLIQKYAGSRWREAQRAKWIIDIVCHIDRDYRHYIMEQAAEIATLHQQLERTNGLQANAAQSIQVQNEQLRQQVDGLEQQLRAAQGAVLDMQNRVAASELVLNEAEEAARAAAEECLQLQQAVAVLAEHDATSRKQLSNRAHVMRDALVASRGRVRQAAEQSRRHRVEVSALLTLAAQQADRDKHALAAQMSSSMAAANTLQRAAARLEVQQLQLELDAYKEPWRYMFRGKSPVKDPEISKRMGLGKPGSMNVAIPF